MQQPIKAYGASIDDDRIYTTYTRKRTLILVEAIETLQSEFSIITTLVLQQLVDSGDEVASCEDAAGGGIGRNRT